MVSDTVLVALIAGIPPTILALAAFVQGVRNGNQLHDLHLEINSRLTQLLEATAKAAHSEGFAAGGRRAGDPKE